jgi:hypothetical protein
MGSGILLSNSREEQDNESTGTGVRRATHFQLKGYKAPRPGESQQEPTKESMNTDNTKSQEQI